MHFSRGLSYNRLMMKAMASLLMTVPICINPAMASEQKLLTAFDAGSADLGWITVNDDVMGGRSSGGFSLEHDRLVFTGSTNTRGGGFSSIRTTRDQTDVAPFRGLRLRVRGDGRTYTFRLATSDSSISWWSEFPTRVPATEAEWEEIELPFASFWPNWRGRRLEDQPIDPAEIRRLGIMINDKRDGHFRLEVDWIKAL